MRTVVFYSLLASIVLSGCSGEKKTDVVDRAMQIQNEGKAATPKEEKPSATPAYTYAIKCAPCHGADGSGKGTYPRLAGQHKDTLLLKLSGYKDGSYGKEQKAIMQGQVKALSDAQIQGLAEHIAQIK